MRTARSVLLLAGLGTGGYGAALFADTGFDNVKDTFVWLAGGVVAHDAVLAPLTLLVAAAVLALRRPSAPLIVGFVCAASLTVVAIPVLGRFGERPDNPTLLDRDYTAGWLAAMAIIAVAALAASALRRRRH